MVGSVTANVGAGLIAAGEENVATSASLLKRASQADKNLVAKLLPLPSAGGLDIRA